MSSEDDDDYEIEEEAAPLVAELEPDKADYGSVRDPILREICYRLSSENRDRGENLALGAAQDFEDYVGMSSKIIAYKECIGLIQDYDEQIVQREMSDVPGMKTLKLN